MSKTNYGERLCLEHMLGISSRTMPTGLKLGLATAASSAEAGTFTLLSAGSGYAEPTVTFVMDNDGQASNAGIVNFGKATANLGHPTHFVVKDGSGNLLRYGVLPNSGFDYNIDVEPSFAIGSLLCTED